MNILAQKLIEAMSGSKFDILPISTLTIFDCPSNIITVPGVTQLIEDNLYGNLKGCVELLNLFGTIYNPVENTNPYTEVFKIITAGTITQIDLDKINAARQLRNKLLLSSLIAHIMINPNLQPEFSKVLPKEMLDVYWL